MKKKIVTFLSNLVFAVMILLGFVSLAHAQVPAVSADASVSANADVSGADVTTSAAATTKAAAKSTRMATNMANAMAKGDTEIDARVTALNNLSARVAQMTRLTDAQKSSVSNEIQTLVTSLTNLKAKIDSDMTTGSTSLKTDMQSITQTYRIYALVLPQINILTALDRLGSINASLATIGAKMQSRLAAAQQAGVNVTSLQASLADYAAKLNDQTTQAQNALSLILPLVPDNGDKTVMASNTAALKSARADIKTATTDITAARKDAQTIVDALAKMKLPAVTASSTAAVSATPATTPDSGTAPAANQ